MSLHENILKQIQQNSNIKPEDIFAIAESVKHANFSDEDTVRNLIRQLSLLANKPISKEKEDQIVETITNNKIPSDLGSFSESDFDD